MQTKLKELALDLGADLVGFCQLPTPPVKELPDNVYAVSIAVKLSDAVLKTIDGAPSFVYFQHYRTANSLLDQIAFRLAREIEKAGSEAPRQYTVEYINEFIKTAKETGVARI